MFLSVTNNRYQKTTDNSLISVFLRDYLHSFSLAFGRYFSRLIGDFSLVLFNVFLIIRDFCFLYLIDILAFWSVDYSSFFH